MDKGINEMKVLYFSVGGLGTNCVIACAQDGHAVIVDPGADAQRILQCVKDNALTVSAVMLTHAHFDQILAAQSVCVATGAPLCVGAADAAMLADPQRNLSSWVTPRTPVSLVADRVLYEGDAISFGEASLTVLETPGHTPGGVCYVGDGVLISGDTLFAGSIGRTDLSGGDMSTLRCSLRRLAELDGEYTVYPGHGEITTLAYEKRANPYLVGV